MRIATNRQSWHRKEKEHVCIYIYIYVSGLYVGIFAGGWGGESKQKRTERDEADDQQDKELQGQKGKGEDGEDWTEGATEKPTKGTQVRTPTIKWFTPLRNSCFRLHSQTITTVILKIKNKFKKFRHLLSNIQWGRFKPVKRSNCGTINLEYCSTEESQCHQSNNFKIFVSTVH